MDLLVGTKSKHEEVVAPGAVKLGDSWSLCDTSMQRGYRKRPTGARLVRFLKRIGGLPRSVRLEKEVRDASTTPNRARHGMSSTQAE